MSDADSSDDEKFLRKYPKGPTPSAMKDFLIPSQDLREAGSSNDSFSMVRNVPRYKLRELGNTSISTIPKVNKSIIKSSQNKPVDSMFSNDDDVVVVTPTINTSMMENLSDCIYCANNFIENSKIVSCKLCKTNYHSKCAKIKDTLFKALKECKNLLWFCDQCVISIHEKLNLSRQIKNIEDKTDKLIKTTTETFENFMNSDENKCSNRWADIIKKNCNDGELSKNLAVRERNDKFADISKAKTADNNKNVLVIREKGLDISKNSSKFLQEEIKKSINPVELKIGIKKITNTRDNAIAISCDCKEGMEKLKGEIEKKFGDCMVVSYLQTKHHKIKLVDLEKQMTREELREVLVKQNQILENVEVFNVITCKKGRKTFMAIIETDYKLFTKIMAKSRLMVEWQSCRVFEYFNVLRCYNCWGYRHTASKCKRETMCSRCGENKHIGNCDRKVQCINCKAVNLNLEFNHSVFDVNCPLYLREVERYKRALSNMENNI